MLTRDCKLLRTFYQEAKLDVYMTKKEKDAIIAKGKADAEAKAKAEEAEKDEADLEEEEDSEIIDDESDEEDESDDDSKEDEDVDIDYEEIAKKETERANAAEDARKKAEDALAGKDFKKRKDKREGNDEDDESDDEEKPLTRRELASALAEHEQRTLSKSQEADALRIARENTSSEKEAQAALLFYKNRVRPTGNLEEDVLFAIGGLNRKKVVAEKSEIVRSLKAKENSSKSFASTQRTGSPAEKGKITSRDAEAIKASGMVWDTSKRVYKKPIGNKMFFYYDPVSKKRWKGK